MMMSAGEQTNDDGDAGACLMRRAGLKARMRRRYIGPSFSYEDGGRVFVLGREEERSEAQIRRRKTSTRRRTRSDEELLDGGRWLGGRP